MKRLIQALLFASLLSVIILSFYNKYLKDYNPYLRRQFEKFVSKPIIIPYVELDKKVCSAFEHQSYLDKDIRLVFYLDSISCLDCTFTTILTYIKREEDLFNNVRMIYIFPIDKDDANDLYSNLCRIRLDGEVYFDTCNAFRKANPEFPKNKVFHTFALDSNNNVIFAGSPISNSENDKVFRKVLQQSI